MTHPVLQRLADTAPPHCAWRWGSDNIGSCELPIVCSDGFRLHYALEIQAHGMRATAKEIAPSHLPAFCPQRHINVDGTFCLYWEGYEQLNIVDEETAEIWWRKLYRFLQIQRRAARQRRWPVRDWAHGAAAGHQAQAEKAAQALGPCFVEHLAAGRLEVLRVTRGGDRRGPILRVRLNGAHLYSTWERSGRVLNGRRCCFCGTSGRRRPKRIRRCGEHEKEAARLAEALYRQVAAEARFWAEVGHRTCCQTCDGCPLERCRRNA